MKIVTQMHSVRQLNNSASGNPAYMLNTDHGSFRTATDASCAYGADNPENMAPNTVELTIERNRVVYIEPKGEALIDTDPTYGKGRFNYERARMNQHAAARRVTERANA